MTITYKYEEINDLSFVFLIRGKNGYGFGSLFFGKFFDLVLSIFFSSIISISGIFFSLCFVEHAAASFPLLRVGRR